MAEASIPAAKRASQACDACKMRKVKCSGGRDGRCQQCEHLDLKCVYATVRQSRKPIQRGRVIATLRENSANHSAFPANLAPIVSPSPGLQRQSNDPTQSPQSAVTSPSQYTESRFDEAYFLDLLPHFMLASYPFHPILAEAEIRYSIANMNTSREHYAFIHAWGGLTSDVKSDVPSRSELHQLCARAIENRAVGIHDMADITIRRIMTSMWIANCLNLSKKSELAFYYMREAISLLQTLQVDDPSMLAKRTMPERAALQRLYCELYIHERFFCLGFGDYHNPVMPALSHLPEDDPTLPPAIQAGFNRIITLFSLVDEVFLRNWHCYRKGVPSPDLTPGWVEQQNRALDDELHDEMLFDMSMLSGMQHADLVITRQWLRTLLWQMAMSKYLLSSSITTKECMSLLFPVKLVQQLRAVIAGIPGEHVRIHGRGICVKLFEVTDTIANVVIHVPAANHEDEAIRVDHFLFLYRFLCTLPRLDPTLKAILEDKMDKIQKMFPSIQGAEHLLEAATLAASH